MGGKSLPKPGLDEQAAAEAVNALQGASLQVRGCHHGCTRLSCACLLSFPFMAASSCVCGPGGEPQQSSAWHAQVAGVAQKEAARNPPPPFITSTLQQDASARAGLSPSATMRLAQQLYEGSETPDGAGAVSSSALLVCQVHLQAR